MGTNRSAAGGSRGRIDARVKAAFVLAVKRGARLEDAAERAGCSLPGLYGARRRDPVFRDAWAEALAISAGPRLIAPTGKRRLQFRRMRHVKFDADRRRTFLAHFAGTCDTKAAAEAAGVCTSTAYKRRLKDEAFARDWDEALQQGYRRLEAEAVRQRIAAAERQAAGIVPEGEVSAEFERVSKLLAQWKRADGRVATRSVSHGRQARWSFDDTMELLDKKLTALGYRVDEGDGEGEENRSDPHPPTATRRVPPSPETGEGQGGDPA